MVLIVDTTFSTSVCNANRWRTHFARTNSLRALKSQIKESNGKLKVDMIDQISAAMEKAEIYLETSKDKLKLVGELDEEFEVFEMDESILKLPTSSSSNDKDGLYLSDIPVETVSQVIINPVEKYSNEAIEDFKVAVEDSPQIVQEKSFSHNDNPEKLVVEVEVGYKLIFFTVKYCYYFQEFPVEFLLFHFSVTLTILSLVVLVGLVAAAAYRLFKTQTEKVRHIFKNSLTTVFSHFRTSLVKLAVPLIRLDLSVRRLGLHSLRWSMKTMAGIARSGPSLGMLNQVEGNAEELIKQEEAQHLSISYFFID